MLMLNSILAQLDGLCQEQENTELKPMFVSQLLFLHQPQSRNNIARMFAGFSFMKISSFYACDIIYSRRKKQGLGTGFFLRSQRRTWMTNKGKDHANSQVTYFCLVQQQDEVIPMVGL